MPKFAADLKLEGFDKLEKGLNPHTFMKYLRPIMRKKNSKMGLILKKKLIEEINSSKKNYAANAFATTQFKGSSNPLVAHGTLRQNCGYRTKWNELRVGTTRKSRKGVDLAVILHEGAKIKVTPKMRKAWLVMAAKTEMRVKPLKASTTHIVIPPRPFLKRALIDDEMVAKMVVAGWKQAMREVHKHFGARLL